MIYEISRLLISINHLSFVSFNTFLQLYSEKILMYRHNAYFYLFFCYTSLIYIFNISLKIRYDRKFG